MKELVDTLGEECRSPEEVLECFAYVLETFYPRFRMTVYSIRKDASGRPSGHLVLQKGYPVSMEEFERMIEENASFTRPYEVTRKAMFLDDYDETSALEGNVFDEGCAAHIPIMSREGLYGWLTLSALDKDYRWSEKDRKWLPVMGWICGSYVSLMLELEKRLEGERRRPRSSLESVRCGLSPDSDSPIDYEATLPSGINSAEWAELRSKLTRRELEVLGMVADGMSNAEISQALFISSHTVRKHLENIFSKLGVSNRTQAAIVGSHLRGGA